VIVFLEQGSFGSGLIFFGMLAGSLVGLCHKTPGEVAGGGIKSGLGAIRVGWSMSVSFANCFHDWRRASPSTIAPTAARAVTRCGCDGERRQLGMGLAPNPHRRSVLESAMMLGRSQLESRLFRLSCGFGILLLSLP
jgi:hypothetical protein